MCVLIDTLRIENERIGKNNEGKINNDDCNLDFGCPVGGDYSSVVCVSSNDCCAISCA